MKEKAQAKLNDPEVQERISGARENLNEGVDKAKEMLDSGLEIVQKQFDELFMGI